MKPSWTKTLKPWAKWLIFSGICHSDGLIIVIILQTLTFAHDTTHTQSLSSICEDYSDDSNLANEFGE
jgi:hypothetical protein